jgi:flagellar FliL protein
MLRAFITASIFSLAVILLPSNAWAEEEAEGEVVQEEIQYVPLKPAFVTNYQDNRLRYFKADVTVKVRGNATADAIARHLPYIRHNLVMLFSAQSGEALNSMEGKQQLQQDAINQVVAALDEENETSQVEGILFTSFIVE